MGWASVNGGTTGGAGGESMTVETRAQFLVAVGSSDPLIILVRDTIELELYERINVNSNKSIIGLTENAMLRYGGLNLTGDNIIVRNLVIGDSYDGDWEGKTNSTDCITVFGENIWVDHCWFRTAADGLLDITSNSSSVADYVTVSYCRFSDHNKVSLIGSSDDNIRDRDHLKTTYHHCWFDGTIEKGAHQRMPRARFGDVHIFNNYFEEIASYCVGARIESDIVIENTYFRNCSTPHEIADLGLGLEDPDIVAIDNVYELCSGTETTGGTAFDPSSFYTYKTDDVRNVPAIVMNGAGTFNPSNNTPPVAINDTLDLSNGGFSLVIDALANDTDTDSEDLRLAQIVNEPVGFGFIKENKIFFAAQTDPDGIDTIAYTVVDTDGGIDTGYVQLFFDGVTSTIKVQKAGKLAIFPNPTRSIVNIKLPQLHFGKVAYSIADISGKKIVQHMELAMNNEDIIIVDCEAFPKGTYIISVIVDQKVYSRQINVL